MARTATEALAVPSMLRWARESSGLSARDAARRLEIDEDQLSRWESGEAKLSVSALEILAHIYKRPLAVFFLPAPPDDDPLPRDFRMLPESRAAFSPRSRLVFRRARRVQGLAAEIAHSLDKTIGLRLGRHRLSDDPEQSASSTRAALGMSVEAQLAWSTDSEALASWRSAVEDHGILVLQASVPVAELRGFSLADQDPPVVLLNGRDAVTARVFSLMHELAHVLLALPGICTMETALDAEGGKRAEKVETVEVFCNRFAGALLVPREALRARVASASLRREWSGTELRGLARRFRVSTEVVLRRLVTLGLASSAFYRRKREEWLASTPSTSRGGLAIPPAQRCLRDNGRAAVSLVLEARHRGAITQRDVADYLGVRMKHVPKVELLLGQSSRP